MNACNVAAIKLAAESMMTAGLKIDSFTMTSKQKSIFSSFIIAIYTPLQSTTCIFCILLQSFRWKDNVSLKAIITS